MASGGNCGGMTKEAYRAFLERNHMTQEEGAKIFANVVARSGRRWALEVGPPFSVALLIAVIKHFEIEVAEVEEISRKMRKKINASK